MNRGQKKELRQEIKKITIVGKTAGKFAAELRKFIIENEEVPDWGVSTDWLGNITVELDTHENA